MSILKFLSGPPPEKIETKGDALFNAGLWGDAKLEYERALAKAQKEGRLSQDWEARLGEKITRTKEALAADHQKTAEDLMDGGYYDEARPLIVLALDMTADEKRHRSLATLAEKLESLQQAEAAAAWEADDFLIGDQAPEEHPEDRAATLDEQYYALCGTLPPDIQKVFANLNMENAKKGEKVQLPEGTWRTK